MVFLYLYMSWFLSSICLDTQRLNGRVKKTVFGKCTIVAVQLKNGFVLVESSSCVDPINYSEAIGMSICIERIKNRLWELEGYKLQCMIGGD